MDVSFVAQTESCCYLLDADGICVWVIPSPGATEGALEMARRCVGAQYVASLDPDDPGILVHDPRPGRALVFARLGANNRVALLRSSPLADFQRLEDAPARAPAKETSKTKEQEAVAPAAAPPVVEEASMPLVFEVDRDADADDDDDADDALATGVIDALREAEEADLAALVHVPFPDDLSDDLDDVTNEHEVPTHKSGSADVTFVDGDAADDERDETEVFSRERPLLSFRHDMAGPPSTPRNPPPPPAGGATQGRRGVLARARRTRVN